MKFINQELLGGKEIWSLNDPYNPKNSRREKNKTQEEKPVSMPVGGDIETEEDLELFLSGIQSETQDQADRQERARVKYSARPEVRQGLVEYNEKQLQENSRQAIYDRVYEEEMKKNPEKAYLAATLAAQRADVDEKEERRLKERIRELKFGEDIERAGNRLAQKASDRQFVLSQTLKTDNPTVDSMERGDAVVNKYNAIANKARNDLYQYNRNNAIAEFENIMFDPEYLSYVEKGSQASPRTFLSFNDTLGKEITRYINDPDYARRYRADDYNYQEVKRLDKLTDDEKNVIRAMASKGDYEGIEGYYGLIERDLNERVQNERNEKVREFSYDYPVLAGVGNVASSFATPFAFFENAGQAIKNKITGEYVPTDINSPAFAATHFGEQSEDGITERVYDAVGGGRVGDIASNVTSGVLSVASDAPKYALGPLGVGLMALDAAGEETHTVLQNGGDPNEALWKSGLKGGITAVANSKLTKDDKLFDVLAPMAEEIILRDDTDYYRNLNAFLESGMTEDEASKKALEKVWTEELVKFLMSEMMDK